MTGTTDRTTTTTTWGRAPLQPSSYERHAWAEIQAWKVARAGDRPHPAVALPTHALTGRRGKLAARAVEAIVPPLSQAMGDVAHWRIDAGALSRVRRAGGHVADLSQVRTLDLSVLDRATMGIRRRYIPSMAVQGAGTGAFGAAGMAVDLPLLVLTNLRAVGEHGVVYGFDLGFLHERLWAGQLLVLGAGASQSVRAGAMLNLQQIAATAARTVGWRELEQFVLVGIMRRTARALGVELTRQRLVRLLPLVGAGVSAAANAAVTKRTCEAAYHLYRERFLLAKYGPSAFGLVPPVEVDVGDVAGQLGRGGA